MYFLTCTDEAVAMCIQCQYILGTYVSVRLPVINIIIAISYRHHWTTVKNVARCVAECGTIYSICTEHEIVKNVRTCDSTRLNFILKTDLIFVEIYLP